MAHEYRSERAAATLTHVGAQCIVAEQLADRHGKVVGYSTFDEKTGFVVVDQRAQSANRGRDDRRAARGRFERDKAERLGVRRHDAHVGRAVEIGEPIVPLRLDPTNLACHVELVGQPAHALRLRLAGGSARAADDDERHRRISERGDAADREIDALQRLDSSDEQQHAASSSMPSRRRAASRSPGANTL